VLAHSYTKVLRSPLSLANPSCFGNQLIAEYLHHSARNTSTHFYNVANVRPLNPRHFAEDAA
jgi:hypothetical protein